MSDPTVSSTPAGESQPQLTSTQQVEKDALLTVEEALKVFALFKSGGVKAAMGEFKPAAELVKQDIADVRVALPEVKTGFKTSEFWLMVVAGIPIVWLQVKGNPLNPLVAASLVAATGIYALIRNALKSKQITATTTVATAK